MWLIEVDGFEVNGCVIEVYTCMLQCHRSYKLPGRHSSSGPTSGRWCQLWPRNIWAPGCQLEDKDASVCATDGF